MKYTDDKDLIRAFAKEGYEGKQIFNPTKFKKDFDNFLTTKKMVSRFLKSGCLNEGLMINNVVIAINAFGIAKTNVIFRMVCPDSQFGVIKAILQFLRSYRPEVGKDIESNRIMQDVLKDLSVRYHLESR